MNEVGYFLLGAALGVAFHIWVLVYSVTRLRAVLDRLNDEKWNVHILDLSVRGVNNRLWGAGMHTAEEERASKRGCYTFELPPEEQTDRTESLGESENGYRQRFLAIGRRLAEQRASEGL